MISFRSFFAGRNRLKSFDETHLLIIFIQSTGNPDAWKLFCTKCNKAVVRKQCSFVNYKPHSCKKCHSRIHYGCRQCDRKYMTHFGIKRHIKVSHDLEPETEHQCPHCAYKTKHNSLLKCHIQRHNPNYKADYEKCPNCGKNYRQLAVHLRRKICAHKKRYTVLYDCPRCERNFSSPNRRKKHIRNCGMKEYQCEHCEQLFEEKSHIASHMRIHMDLCD